VKGLGQKLALALGSLLLAFVVCELAVRLAWGRPPRGNITPVPAAIREPSDVPGLPYVLRPGAEAVHRFPDDPRGAFDPGATLTYRTNRLGFRGPETSLAKPPGVFRIVGLGGSTHQLFNVAGEDAGAGAVARRSVLVDRALWTIERRRQTRQLEESYRTSFTPAAPPGTSPRAARAARRRSSP
jgi:hypothetical protein